MKLMYLRELLALHHLRVLKTLTGCAVVVEQHRVIFQDAALHLEVIDSAREWVGQRFENEQWQRLGIVVFALNPVALSLRLPKANLRMLVGMWKHIGQERKQTRCAYIAQSGHHQHGEDLLRNNRFAHAGNQILYGD